MGTVDERMVRKIYLLQDYSKVLAVTKPTAKSCVQVIDGRNPIYSPFDSSRIAAVGFASEPDRILLDGVARYPDPALFGAEPAREWCYSYAQMSVAQQKQDWAEAARIADAAIVAGYHSEDPASPPTDESTYYCRYRYKRQNHYERTDCNGAGKAI